VANSISKKLEDELSKKEREGIEDSLWEKSGGKCFLCDEPMSRASDVIVIE